MLIIPSLNFLIEFLGPVMVIVDILGQLDILFLEIAMAVRLDILLVLTDDRVSKEVTLVILLLIFIGLMLSISYEFGVVLLLLLEILGVVGLDLTHFLYGVYFA